MGSKSTGAIFIAPLGESGPGPRLAVKDVIDVAGVPTTAGCRAVADRALPAVADAPCLAGARRAGAPIVGKANLHELGFGVSGINPWYGTPVNPVAPDRVPGGSSSGPAVAVASGEADIGLGTDTGGSVRIPAACCGVAGLKTTFGRIPVEGVWPLAPSLDSVGPLARDVAGLVTAMALLEPGFEVGRRAPTVIGRLRPTARPEIDAAIDAALADAGFEIVEIDLPWDEADEAARVVLLTEVWSTLGHLAVATPEGLGDDTRRRFADARRVGAAQREAADAVRAKWRVALADVFRRVELLALPTLTDLPTLVGEPSAMHGIRRTLAVNLAGVPALSLPVARSGLAVPPSLQLVGPWDGEAGLLAAGLTVELAVASATTSSVGRS